MDFLVYIVFVFYGHFEELKTQQFSESVGNKKLLYECSDFLLAFREKNTSFTSEKNLVIALSYHTEIIRHVRARMLNEMSS